LGVLKRRGGEQDEELDTGDKGNQVLALLSRGKNKEGNCKSPAKTLPPYLPNKGKTSRWGGKKMYLGAPRQMKNLPVTKSLLFRD